MVALRAWRWVDGAFQLYVSSHSLAEHKAIADVYRRINPPVPLEPRAHTLWSTSFGVKLLVTYRGQLIAPLSETSRIALAEKAPQAPSQRNLFFAEPVLSQDTLMAEHPTTFADNFIDRIIDRTLYNQIGACANAARLVGKREDSMRTLGEHILGVDGPKGAQAALGLSFDGTTGEWDVLAKVNLAELPGLDEELQLWVDKGWRLLPATSGALKAEVATAGDEYSYANLAIARMFDTF